MKPLSESERRFAASLTEAAMGIDALARRDPVTLAALGPVKFVPLYSGEALIQPRPYRSWEEARADLQALRARLEDLDHGPRRVFSAAMLVSLAAAARLFSGGNLTFADKVADLAGADAGPVAAHVSDECSDAIDASLRRLGHSRGPLADRLQTWESERRIAPEDLARVFAALAAQARRRTQDRIFDTGGYTMALTPVRGVTYTARCGFASRQMQLNMDIAFTRASLKHLICHEIFPGHATQMLSTRSFVEDGTSGADALLCAANAVTGCVQEGIGDQAVELIEWVEDEDDLIYAALKRLRSAEQATAAWRLMAEGADEAGVASDLKERAFGQDAWVAGRLAMARHPFNGPFIATYWTGGECVRKVRERVTPAQRRAFLRTLYGDAHSPGSLALFGADEPPARERRSSRTGRGGP